MESGAEFTIPAPGTVDVISQAVAMRSNYRWSTAFDITVEGMVRGRPADGSQTTDYWAGMTINGNLVDSDYVELAAQRDVTPTNNPNCNVVTLTQAGEVVDNFICSGDPSPWLWHPFKIEWVARQQKVYYWTDKVLRRVRNHTFSGSDVFIELTVVSVPINTPDNGSACEAQYGPLYVWGEKV